MHMVADNQIHDPFRAAVLAQLDHLSRGARAELAARAGISRPYLANILNGDRHGSEDARRAIARALGWSLDGLIQCGRQLLDESPAHADTPPQDRLDAVLADFSAWARGRVGPDPDRVAWLKIELDNLRKKVE